MFPNVFCLQTSSYRASIIAALGALAACPCRLKEAWLLFYSVTRLSLGCKSVLPHLIKTLPKTYPGPHILHSPPYNPWERLGVLLLFAQPVGLSGHTSTYFFFPLRKQTKCNNMGHFYTQGEFQSMFFFGNSKKEKGSLQSKVKHCGLEFPFKEKYRIWDNNFFYIRDISKFLLKNVKMLSRMATF